MISHIVVVATIMLTIGFWECIFGFLFIGLIFYQIVPYFLVVDNHLHKVGSTLWGPIHSYFYECLRGTNVIRAFGQEHSIMAKQHKLLDKTTTHFIAHHSCWCWYNLRMMYASYLFYGLAMMLIAKNRGNFDTVTLVLLFNWTNDMGWIMHVTTCFSWFKRNVVETQRVFNLHKVPMEKVEGPDGTPKNWPSQGELNFEDVYLRYRPVCDRALNGITFKV